MKRCISAITVIIAVLALPTAALATTGVGTHTDWAWSKGSTTKSVSMRIQLKRIGSYTYWAFGGQFADGLTGDGWYMGLQTDGSNFSGKNVGDQAIFSIWEARGGTTHAHGGQCGQFGGEGTGGSCHVPIKLIANHTYLYKVTRSTKHDDVWTAAITDQTAHRKTITIGTITAPAPDGTKTRDTKLDNMYSFLEDFGPGDDSCKEQPASGLYYDPVLGHRKLTPVLSSVSYGHCVGAVKRFSGGLGAAVDTKHAPRP